VLGSVRHDLVGIGHHQRRRENETDLKESYSVSKTGSKTTEADTGQPISRHRPGGHRCRAAPYFEEKETRPEIPLAARCVTIRVAARIAVEEPKPDALPILAISAPNRGGYITWFGRVVQNNVI
jgi:hypothetical protein